MLTEGKITRRAFIIAAGSIGGGLALGFYADKKISEAAKQFTSVEFNPWLVIHPDDTVTIRVTTPEAGNGAATQMAMTIVEELQCDWSKVNIEYGTLAADDGNARVFSNSAPVFAFFSGRSTQTERNRVLLQVGASARERLKLAAAQTWREPVAEIIAEKGRLIHKPTGKMLTYGAMAGKAAEVVLDAEPALKPRSEWTFLGKATPPKWHIPQIVSGKAQYGIDIRLPNMLYAALMQSPVQDGKLKSHDGEKIKAMPGVHGIVEIKGGAPRKNAPELASQPYLLSDDRTSAIAVVADHYWQARKALEMLNIVWEDGAGAAWKTTEQVFQAAESLIGKNDGTILKESDKIDESIAASSKQIEATYTTPFCDQAPMEPLNGTALVTPERIDLWHPTQITDNARATVVEESGFAPEQVFIHQTLVGGAFGRRTTCDDVRMVVAVASQFPGKPIHVIWSREEMFRQGRYRALLATKFKAGLNADGMPDALIAQSVGRAGDTREPFTAAIATTPTMGLMDSPYISTCIAQTRIVRHALSIHIRSGSYRGPYYNSNCFMLESFVDECAHAASIDPLEYRLRLLKAWPDPGWVACLKEAGRQADWGKVLPKGMAQGIAIGNFGSFGKPQAGTTVGVVATVEVTPAGKLTVQQIDLALDCGSYMNKDAVRAQMEGGVLYGLNMALNEKLTIKDGRIVEGNFDAYPMLRMADTPKINIHFGAMTNHERFAELGEAPVGPVGPAIANAIFKITGKRLRSTPFRAHDLSYM